MTRVERYISMNKAVSQIMLPLLCPFYCLERYIDLESDSASKLTLNIEQLLLVKHKSFGMSMDFTTFKK